MNTSKIGLLVINGPVPPPYGGIATYLSFTLPYLAEREFEVHSIMDAPPTDSGVHARFKDQGLNLYYGKATTKERVFSALGHPLTFFLLFFQARLPIKLFLATVNSIARWLDVAEKILQTREIDLIHAYDYPWAQGWVASRLAKKYKKKYIQTTFGEIVPHKSELMQYDNESKLYKAHVHNVLTTANTLISVSRHCAKVLQYVGIDPNLAKVCYHGVNLSDFHPYLSSHQIRDQLHLGDYPIVLFVGHLRARKGPQVLLEAIPSILEEKSDCRFLFLGPDKGILPELKKRAAQLRIEKNVLFVGPVLDKELPLFFAACDIFVFPTVTPIECLGLTMIQAMACGKPVVGSNINGIPEVVIDGETGFLVEPGNPQSISDSVVKLLMDSNLRTSMGERSYKRVSTFFSQERLGEDLRQIYLNVVQSKILD